MERIELATAAQPWLVGAAGGVALLLAVLLLAALRRRRRRRSGRSGREREAAEALFARLGLPVVTGAYIDAGPGAVLVDVASADHLAVVARQLAQPVVRLQEQPVFIVAGGGIVYRFREPLPALPAATTPADDGSGASAEPGDEVAAGGVIDVDSAEPVIVTDDVVDAVLADEVAADELPELPAAVFTSQALAEHVPYHVVREPWLATFALDHVIVAPGGVLAVRSVDARRVQPEGGDGDGLTNHAYLAAAGARRLEEAMGDRAGRPTRIVAAVVVWGSGKPVGGTRRDAVLLDGHRTQEWAVHLSAQFLDLPTQQLIAAALLGTEQRPAGGDRFKAKRPADEAPSTGGAPSTGDRPERKSPVWPAFRNPADQAPSRR